MFESDSIETMEKTKTKRMRTITYLEKDKITKEKTAIAKKFKLPSQNPFKQIRKNCLECCGDSPKTVMFCASINCSLWYFRFGKRPKAVIRSSGEKYAGLFDKKNFQPDGRYDPNIRIEDMNL